MIKTIIQAIKLLPRKGKKRHMFSFILTLLAIYDMSQGNLWYPILWLTLISLYNFVCELAINMQNIHIQDLKQTYNESIEINNANIDNMNKLIGYSQYMEKEMKYHDPKFEPHLQDIFKSPKFEKI